MAKTVQKHQRIEERVGGTKSAYQVYGRGQKNRPTRREGSAEMVPAHPAQAGDGDVADRVDRRQQSNFGLGHPQPGGKVGQDEKINAHIGVEQKRGGHHPNHETLPNPI
ncbi:MAG: hypothetical protein ACLVL7_00415 [Anaerotruncus massiliensis (ex Togo et al. 2019)]